MSIFSDQVHFSLYSLNHREAKARLSIKKSELSLPCAIGKNGQSIFKKEGDNKTPIGIWRPLKIYYRADRTKRPISKLPIQVIKPTDGWCDEPFDRNYNRPVSRPYNATSETLWRTDHIYDLIIVLDHNQCPRKQGAGSAIFIHLARSGFSPTEGCIALSKPHLYQFMSLLSKKTTISI